MQPEPESQSRGQCHGESRPPAYVMDLPARGGLGLGSVLCSPDKPMLLISFRRRVVAREADGLKPNRMRPITRDWYYGPSPGRAPCRDLGPGRTHH